jgi:hypothetical protein
MGFTVWKVVREGNKIKFQYPKYFIYIGIASIAIFVTFVGVVWGVILPRNWAKKNEISTPHGFQDFPTHEHNNHDNNNNNNNNNSSNYNNGNNSNNINPNSHDNNSNNSNNNNNNHNNHDNNNNNNNRGSPNATDPSQTNRGQGQNNFKPNSMMCTFGCDSDYRSCKFNCEGTRYMSCEIRCSSNNDFDCKECAPIREACETTCSAKKSTCYDKCD